MSDPVRFDSLGVGVFFLRQDDDAVYQKIPNDCGCGGKPNASVLETGQTLRIGKEEMVTVVEDPRNNNA
jgi:hypothetical protein